VPDSDLEVRERLVKLESRVDSLATRDWVREMVDPIKAAAIETAHAVTGLSSKFESLFNAHKEMVDERREQQREEHQARLAAAEKNTWPAILKDKWTPVLAFLSLMIAVSSAIGGLACYWILNYVLKKPH